MIICTVSSCSAGLLLDLSPAATCTIYRVGCIVIKNHFQPTHLVLLRTDIPPNDIIMTITYHSHHEIIIMVFTLICMDWLLCSFGASGHYAEVCYTM